MNFSLSEEQEMIISNIRKLTKKYNRQYFLDNYEKGTFPEELWLEMGSLGFLGITVPEQYGGLSLGIQELAIVEEELSRAGLPIILLVVSPALGVIVVNRHGTSEQKERFLPCTVDGSKKFCFAITEPDSGTNTFNIKTFAKKNSNGDYVLSGQKQFITGFDISDYMLLVARTSPYDPNDRKKGLSLFIVDTKDERIKSSNIETEVAKVEKQFMLYFDDVIIPKENLIGEEGKGISYIFDGLNPERIMIASLCIGLGEYVLNKAVKYSKERVVFSDPIGKYQSLQHPMAEAKAQLELAKLMNRKAAWTFDKGEKSGHFANVAKLTAADAAMLASNIALQIHGGNGFTKEYDLLGIHSLLRLQQTAPISREMILNYIGEHMLGLPKSY